MSPNCNLTSLFGVWVHMWLALHIEYQLIIVNWWYKMPKKYFQATTLFYFDYFYHITPRRTWQTIFGLCNSSIILWYSLLVIVSPYFFLKIVNRILVQLEGLCKSNVDCSFCHVKREGNKLDHALARRAVASVDFDVWLEDLPRDSLICFNELSYWVLKEKKAFIRTS